MRKFMLLGWAAVLASIFVVRGQQTTQLSDQEIQHRLTGTWVSAWGRGLITTNVIAADGSFVSTTGGFTNGVTVGYQGTFRATNGVVVGKAKVDKQTVDLRLHVIRLDSHELVWSNDMGVTEPAFHKIGG